MSLKRFKADVRAARLEVEETGILGVLSIDRGDSEGAVNITFIHEKLHGPLIIQLLTQNLGAYPDGSNFLLSAKNHETIPAVTLALEKLQDSTVGQSMVECINGVSASLSNALDSADGNGSTIIDHENASQSSSDNEDRDWDVLDGDEDLFGCPPVATMKRSSFPNEHHEYQGGILPEDLQRLKKDLRAVRQGGYRVGISEGVNEDSYKHIIAISTRVSKLGLSTETVEAWDVDPSHYIVLLVEIEGRYPSTDKLEVNTLPLHMRFRFGSCDRYKPSLQDARHAFSIGVRPDWTAEDMSTQEADTKPFTKLFISNSLERFMNEDFIHLVKLRLRGSASWNDANVRLQELNHVAFSDVGPKEENRREDDQEDHPLKSHDNKPDEIFTNNVLPDAFASPPEDISLLLAAMQFATHYFVRCTEYCLRCHCRLPKEFEASKPFVCSKPLCLFQYMAMGLGPSIEHEILTQPYVVDLLVNLCYSSVAPQERLGGGFTIREFPVGLRLQVPRLKKSPSSNKQTSSGPIAVDVNVESQHLVATDPADLHRLSPGMFALLQPPHSQSIDPPLNQVLIQDVSSPLNRVTFEFKHIDPSFAQDTSSGNIKKMTLIPFDQDLDELSQEEKASAICMLLSILPPVADLRSYLLEHPTRNLASCPGLSVSARLLLQWIVASNRSYILQVSPVEEMQGKDQHKLFIRGSKTRPGEQIPGLGPGFVQFRFAQGSPDKELRFQRALNELAARKATMHPTIFAWHGSSLSNWHSILRQGLDYQKILNGRSYGHGVYFAREYETSAGYSPQVVCWPKSALQPAGVVSLCEIINDPEAFVSKSPFYVVPQVDWIQCRYLIVKRSVDQSTPVEPQGNDGMAKMDEIAQDPKHLITGPGRILLRIPAKALPSSRARQQKKKASKLHPKRRSESLSTDEEEAADLKAIFSDVDSLPPRTKQCRTKGQRDTAWKTMTDFRPGSLDLTSLPCLSLPWWANSESSKRLATDIKHVQKIQSTTPLHELGWYFHLDNINNMFQWIVELHSFDPELPLAKDMKQAGITSIVLEIRFGRDYPFSPPFVRVIRPQFLPFMNGGGESRRVSLRAL